MLIDDSLISTEIDEKDLQEMGLTREEYFRMISEMKDQLLEYESNQVDEEKLSDETQEPIYHAKELETHIDETDEEEISSVELNSLFVMENKVETKNEMKNLSKKARRRKEKKQTLSNNSTPSDFINPTQFWPNYEEIIRNRISKYYNTSQINITKITNITNSELLDKFKSSIEYERSRIKKESPQLNLMKSIELGLHGTESSNIESIINKGLLIPHQENDVKIRNGQSHGFGIYVTITDPSESIHYCRGGGKMLACAVILSNRFNVSHYNDFAVIRDEAFVLPCFLVEFTQSF